MSGSLGVLFVAAMLAAVPAAGLAAPRVVAVLSSSLAPYKAALEGFRESVGVPVAVADLSTSPPENLNGAEIIVAFGGKAALGVYPRGATLVYCMAPGTNIPTDRPGNGPIKVHMLPHPGALVAELRAIQPRTRRLAVVWSSVGIEPYLDQLREAASASSLEVVLERVVEEGLPSSLRRVLKQGPDALWLPPDPLLVNSESFSVVKAFTWSNRIPFYAPSSSLVERGAAVSVACDFREIGRAAGGVVRLLLAGKEVRADVYPERVTTTLSASASAACGLTVPPDILRRADHVYP